MRTYAESERSVCWNCFEKITEGRGELKDLDKLEETAKFIQSRSLCGLGKSAPLPVISTLQNFRDEYEEHIVEGKMPCPCM